MLWEFGRASLRRDRLLSCYSRHELLLPLLEPGQVLFRHPRLLLLHHELVLQIIPARDWILPDRTDETAVSRSLVQLVYLWHLERPVLEGPHVAEGPTSFADPRHAGLLSIERVQLLLFGVAVVGRGALDLLGLLEFLLVPGEQVEHFLVAS